MKLVVVRNSFEPPVVTSVPFNQSLIEIKNAWVVFDQKIIALKYNQYFDLNDACWIQ